MGPGQPLQQLLGPEAPIVATIYCGDNYVAENEARATEEILALVEAERPDLFVAGPAFGAGRYGLACGALSVAVAAKLGIPVLTAMSPSNPGADRVRRGAPVVATGESAREMTPALQRMAPLMRRLLDGAPLGSAETEGLVPRGVRMNAWADRPAAARAVDMLLAKVAGAPFRTEVPLPSFDDVPPAAPVSDIGRAKVALVTTAGIVPRGNPDRLTSYHSTRWGAYSMAGIDDLRGDALESVHGGFLTAAVNEDPDRMLPVDVLRDLVKEGAVGALHETFYSTVGNGTPAETASRLGREIAGALRAEGVDGVILTAA